MITFDEILSNRVGFGKSQLRTFAIVGFIDFLDGAEAMYVSLLNTILFYEWNMTVTQLIILGAIFNIGLFIGGIICSFYADTFGRRNFLIAGSIIQFFAVLMTAFASDLHHMYMLRFFYGLVMGLSLPISAILITEITPSTKRGRLITLLQIMYIFGHVWTIIIAGFFLISISEGNWRGIAIMNALPCLLCFFGTIFFVKESARFYVCTGQFDIGIKGINEMGKTNSDNYQNLTEQEIESLKQWQQSQFGNEVRNKSFSGLFNEQNYPITWRVWSMAILFFFVFAGIYLIVPFILDKENKSLLDLFWTTISEIPAVFLVLYLIDFPSVGRVKIITMGILSSAVCLAIIWYYEQLFLVMALSFFNFFARIIFLAFTPLVTESYNTVYRSLGIGFCICLGRISGAISPLVIFPMHSRDPYEPFLLGLAFMLIIFFIMLTYPQDRTLKPLDGNINNIVEETNETDDNSEKQKLLDEKQN